VSLARLWRDQGKVQQLSCCHRGHCFANAALSVIKFAGGGAA
jgi:hypothetical protein